MHLKGLIPADITMKYGAILIAVYSLGRSIAKATKTTKDDEFFAKLDQIIQQKLDK
jgi:hypothetical protein